MSIVFFPPLVFNMPIVTEKLIFKSASQLPKELKWLAPCELSNCSAELNGHKQFLSHNNLIAFIGAIPICIFLYSCLMDSFRVCVCCVMFSPTPLSREAFLLICTWECSQRS